MKKSGIIFALAAVFLMLTGCSEDNRIAEGLADIAVNIGDMFAEFGRQIESGEAAERLAEYIDGGRVWLEDMPGMAPSVDELIEKGEIVLPEEEMADIAAEDGIETEAAGYGGELSDEEIMLNTKGMLRFSYARLSESGRQIYKDIYAVLINQAREVKLNTTNTEEVDKVFMLVMNDHPEIFYVTGYSVGKMMLKDMVLSLEFTGTYDRDEEAVAKGQEIIDSYTRKCLSQLPAGSDYDKAKYIYEYIIDHTEYELGAEDNQNLLSVFGGGKSVCNGYAKATQYLLNQVGIPCLLISGTARGEGHAWNEAYLDGHWTYIDTTWGDASYRNIATGDTWNEISYDYFAVGDEEFLETHHADGDITVPRAERMER